MSAVRVVVVGDVMLDVVTRPTAPIAATSDTAAVTRVGRGGSGANLAVALARPGLEVTYVGAAGRDASAAVIVDDLTRAGVRARLQDEDGATGVVVAVVAPDGQRAMITDRGANPRLRIDHVAGVLDEPFDHLHVSGYTVLDEHTRPVATAALELARRAGATTSVDVCSVAPLRAVGSVVFSRAVAAATTLFANEEEALALAGRADLERAVVDLAATFAEVVVTRGAGGALARRGDREWRVDAASAVVLDTTGAGDAATGAYLAATLLGGEPGEALAAAMAAAAVVVAGLGARG
ncbi:MAG: carbohydrate kinase family protein [Acidimicrobiales bacterium]